MGARASHPLPFTLFTYDVAGETPAHQENVAPSSIPSVEISPSRMSGYSIRTSADDKNGLLRYDGCIHISLERGTG